jgi:hypothetical protein
LSSGYPEEKPIGFASPYFLGIEYGEPVLPASKNPPSGSNTPSHSSIAQSLKIGDSVGAVGVYQASRTA